MIQEGMKMSPMQGIETRVLLASNEAKYFKIFFIAISAPWMFTHLNINNLVFASHVTVLRNFKLVSITFGEELKENILFKIVIDVLFY